MEDKTKKPSFLVYYDNEVIVLRLQDEEAGRLFKSLFPYGRRQVKPDFEENPALAMAFDILSMAIDRDNEKYERRCDANRENGRKGGRPKKDQTENTETQKSERFFSKPKKADKDRDKDMDMDKDSQKDKDMQKDNIRTVCSEPEKTAPNPSGILLPLNDKTSYDVPLDKIAVWKDAYPAVNVEQELKRMAAWLDSNPTRRKTRRGITKFINTWLSREQDEGGRFKGSRQQGQELTPQDYELPEEYREMYKKHLGKKPPSPDDPFQ